MMVLLQVLCTARLTHMMYVHTNSNVRLFSRGVNISRFKIVTDKKTILNALLSDFYNYTII